MKHGQRLRDRYELRERIARGGMGEVWRAFDLRLEREVAIKTSTPGPDAPPLIEEGRAAALLDHPNIVAVHDVDVYEDEPFIVMEYVAGPSLRKLLERQGPLPEADAIRIGTDILGALAYAHGRGVWHNDVKPENILIGRDGDARLTDFGVASVRAETVDLRATGARFATVAYAAPEVLAGSPGGTAADLYALAMTLYECVSGSVPEREPAGAGLTPSIVPPLRQSAPYASVTLEEVLARALDPEATKRYRSADAFRSALEDCSVESHATVALPPRRPHVRANSSRWQPLVVGAALTGVVGLGVGTAVWSLVDDGNAPGMSSEESSDNPALTETQTVVSTPTPAPTQTPTATPTPRVATPTPQPPEPPLTTREDTSMWGRAWDGLSGIAGSLWDRVRP